MMEDPAAAVENLEFTRSADQAGMVLTVTTATGEQRYRLAPEQCMAMYRIFAGHYPPK